MPPLKNRGYGSTQATSEPHVANPAGEALRVKIQQDNDVRRIVSWTRGIKLNPRLTEELNGYHITAKNLAKPGNYEFGVSLRFQNPRQDLIDIITASLKIQAYRDRVCEIQLDLLRSKQNLTRFRKLGHDVIQEKFGSQLSILFKSFDSQKSFIDSVIAPITSRLAVVTGNLEQIDAVLQNLDKAHYTYKEVGQLAEKLFSRVEGGHQATRSA